MTEMWQCVVCLERQPLLNAACRDCGAPLASLIPKGQLYSLLSICLGLQLRASASPSPSSLLSPQELGTEFLTASGFDTEESLSAAIRGDGILRIQAPLLLERRLPSLSPRALLMKSQGAPFFGLRKLPRVGIAYDERHLTHLSSSSASSSSSSIHPERPDRAQIAIGWLAATGLLQSASRLYTREASSAEVSSVTTTPAHNKWLEKGRRRGEGGDTYLTDTSPIAARVALGSSIEATLAVWRGALDRALVLVRPPGHHARDTTGAGFCIYNNVAGAARAALADGAQRILIVDWDVHHGDGTEELFWDDPRVVTLSMHRYDKGGFYPGSGTAKNVGGPKARGRTVNVGLNGEWFGDADYISIFEMIVCPLTRSFDPDLIIVSAGFDAARGDALGDCDITPAGYAALTSSIISCAPQIPLILILEGGYNLQSVGASVESVTRVLFGEVAISTSAYDLIPNRVAESTILDGGDGGCGISSYSNEDAQALKSDLLTARRWRESNVERQLSDIHPRRRVRPATWYAIEETLRAQAPFWPCFSQALAARERDERELEEHVDETDDLLASLSLN